MIFFCEFHLYPLSLCRKKYLSMKDEEKELATAVVLHRVGI